MSKRIPLNVVKVASPCPADWNMMIGDDRTRYCGQCNLNVYNLSGMTKFEAENLINRVEGRLCIRFYQRPDGTILTNDCPVGVAAFRKRMKRCAEIALGSILGFLAILGFIPKPVQTGRLSTMGELVPPVRKRNNDSPPPANRIDSQDRYEEITGRVAFESLYPGRKLHVTNVRPVISPINEENLSRFQKMLKKSKKPSKHFKE